jgi:hypothetical protein
MITVLFIFDLESAKIIQSEIRGNKHAWYNQTKRWASSTIRQRT